MKHIGALVLLLLFATVASAERVKSNLILLYDFAETAGTVIHDNSSVSPALDLSIPDISKVELLKPGLRVKSATLLKAANARTKLDPNKFFSQGITIEAWIKPLNNTQSGPARIVTFSQNSENRNFTLGQSSNYYNQRFRTSLNPGNGTNPSLSTPANSIEAIPKLQHVVYTRNSSGTANFYIDKLKVQTVEVPGDGSNWVGSYDFGLFNETNYPTDTRTWLGDIFLVAIYDKALSDIEIAQNFDSGFSQNTGSVTLAWDANTEPDLLGYKIHYSKATRMTTSYGYMQKWCDEHEPTSEKCLEEWQAICKDSDDQACHFMLYPYDTVIDVKLNPDGWNKDCGAVYDPFKTECCEFTLRNIPNGNYFLAGTAYDKDGNESSYSEELYHTFGTENPDTIINLRRIENIE